MELVLQTGISASTGPIAAFSGKQPSTPFSGPARSFVVRQTTVGAMAGTVTIYQVLQKDIKRPIGTITLDSSKGVQGFDLVNAGQTFIAEVFITANPSNDTVDVVMEG